MEIALLAVTQNPESLKHAKIQSEKVILRAVESNGYTITFAHFTNEAIHLAAVNQDVHSLLRIDNPSESAILTAVKLQGLLLGVAPIQTPDIVVAALNSNGNALQYVKNQTEELCLLAIKHSSDAFTHCRNKTKKLIEYIALNDPYQLSYVRYEPELDDQFWIELLSKERRGFALQALGFRSTPEIALAAVKKNWKELQFCRHLTEEICVAAYEQSPLAFDAPNFTNSAAFQAIWTYDLERRLAYECYAHRVNNPNENVVSKSRRVFDIM